MKKNGVIRVLAVLVVIIICLTGCTTACTTLTINLVERRTQTGWDVSFDAMNGYMSTSFNNIYESAVLNYQITYGEGEIIVRLRQGSRSQELSMAESSISLSDWDHGKITIELNAKAARYARLSFSWGAGNGGGTI